MARGWGSGVASLISRQIKVLKRGWSSGDHVTCGLSRRQLDLQILSDVIYSVGSTARNGIWILNYLLNPPWFFHHNPLPSCQVAKLPSLIKYSASPFLLLNFAFLIICIEVRRLGFKCLIITWGFKNQFETILHVRSNGAKTVNEVSRRYEGNSLLYRQFTVVQCLRRRASDGKGVQTSTICTTALFKRPTVIRKW